MTEVFNLYPLHVFRTVARHGSVTRAAQELCISQPAVSNHVRSLETQYAIRLFERTPQGMRLTPAGIAITARANRLFAEWEDIGEAVRSSSGEVRGEVTIAASTTPGAYLLPHLLRRFKERYPDAEPILLIGDSAQVVGWLRDYRAPLACIIHEGLPCRPSGCSVARVGASDVGSPGYLANNRSRTDQKKARGRENQARTGHFTLN